MVSALTYHACLCSTTQFYTKALLVNTMHTILSAMLKAGDLSWAKHWELKSACWSPHQRTHKTSNWIPAFRALKWLPLMLKFRILRGFRQVRANHLQFTVGVGEGGGWRT